MTNNISMKLSAQLKEELSTNLLPLFYKSVKSIVVGEDSNDTKFRDRVFNQCDTLLTMISTSTQTDKSLQNSVNIFSQIHEENIKRITEFEKTSMESALTEKRSSGRPRKYFTSAAKSKQKSISSNTSAFSQARNRLKLSYVKEVFEYSSKSTTNNKQIFFGRACIYYRWHISSNARYRQHKCCLQKIKRSWLSSWAIKHHYSARNRTNH